MYRSVCIWNVSYVDFSIQLLDSCSLGKSTFHDFAFSLSMASQFNMATKYGKLQLEPYSGASTKVADRGMGQAKNVSWNLSGM